jgi:hypothetical protein
MTWELLWPTVSAKCDGGRVLRSAPAITEAKLGPNIQLAHPGCGANYTVTHFLLIHSRSNGRNGYGGGKAAKRSSQHRQNTGSADEKTPCMSPHSIASTLVHV